MERHPYIQSAFGKEYQWAEKSVVAPIRLAGGVLQTYDKQVAMISVFVFICMYVCINGRMEDWKCMYVCMYVYMQELYTTTPSNFLTTTVGVTSGRRRGAGERFPFNQSLFSYFKKLLISYVLSSI